MIEYVFRKVEQVKYRSIFDLFTDVCEKAHVSSILVGGFAVNYHKFTRATNDVDFMMTEEDFEKVRPLLEEAGYALATKQSLVTRMTWRGGDPTKESGFFIDLDILFVDPKTFQGVLAGSHEANFQGAKTRVISLHHLMAMKLYSLKNSSGAREDPDLTDLVRLVQNNKIDMKSALFRDLWLKYGTAELYDKIVEKVRLWKS